MLPSARVVSTTQRPRSWVVSALGRTAPTALVLAAGTGVVSSAGPATASGRRTANGRAAAAMPSGLQTDFLMGTFLGWMDPRPGCPFRGGALIGVPSAHPKGAR